MTDELTRLKAENMQRVISNFREAIVGTVEFVSEKERQAKLEREVSASLQRESDYFREREDRG